MNPSVDLVVEAGDWPQEDRLLAWFDEAIAATVRVTPFNLRHGEISVVLTDDDAMQTINQEHRGQNKPTNVLSFPALEPDMLAKLDGKHPFLLGDLVFALQTVKREAEAGQISFHHHMSHLIVHGFLHLLGYDHEQDLQAEAMEALETRILATLDIADPYRDGAQTNV